MLKEQDERNAFSLSDTDNWTQAPEVSGNPPFILSITRFMQCKETEKKLFLLLQEVRSLTTGS